MSPVHWASLKKNLTMVKYLESLGADILKPKKEDGFTILHLAAEHNDV